ncbi:MAG: SirB1 family protein [Planctomycetia bacterium]
MTAFSAIANGQPASIVAAALEFAADEHPAMNIPCRLAEIDGLAYHFAAGVDAEATPLEILDRLNDYFFNWLGFAGDVDDYYDPTNSYLHCVVERRRGIPISLAVLYRHLAERAGVKLHGVNLPGHFMLGMTLEHGERVYIDVFHGGRRLTWQQCIARLEWTAAAVALREKDFPPMTDRAVMVRMLRNLKSIFWKAAPARCLPVQCRLSVLLPDDPGEQRDLGVLYFRTGRPMLAMRVLERLAAAAPEMADEREFRAMLQKATREAVLVN